MINATNDSKAGIAVFNLPSNPPKSKRSSIRDSLGKQTQNCCVSVLNLNIRSLCNKKHLFELELKNCRNLSDIIHITESWFKMNFIMPLEGYLGADSFNRSMKKGGGSVIYASNGTVYSECHAITSLGIESIIEISAIAVDQIRDLKLAKPTYFISIYRPPVEGEAFNTFLDRMDALFSWLHDKKHFYFVSGDFNVDFLDHKCQKTKAFCNLLESFKIKPVFQDTPSRVAKSSSTLIDNCFTNVPIKDSATHDFGLSDHYGQIVSLDFKKLAEQSKAATRPYRLWSEANKFSLGSLLVYLFSFLTNCAGSLQTSFENFNIQIYNAIERSCPLKPGKSKSRKKINYDKKLKDLLEEKKHYFLLFKQTRNKKFKKACNKASKKLSKELYRQKRSHNDSEILNSRNKGKTVWRIINSETIAGSQTWIKSIELNNKEIFDPYNIANEFNQYFSTMALSDPRAVSYCDALDILHKCYPSPTKCFKFQTIDLEQLYSIIVGLKPNKSDSNGNIPTFVFKEYFHIIGKPLLSLLNSCLIDGTFPDFMKVGTITPLFKKGSRKLITNYRPISVLPTVCKIFEKIVYLQLNSYFESNNLISKSQFGFRRKMSTVHAIQNLIENIFKAFESKIPALSLHFDLAKAFDSIDHKLLLDKLKFYGLGDDAMRLMSSYLTNRKQVVKINTPKGDIYSKTCTVRAGVPQGSILGPLLFNIFINDLPKYVNFSTYLFADDTSAVLLGEEVFTSVKVLYSQISVWFTANGLKLNEDKSQALCFTPSSHVNPPLQAISLSDTTEIKLSDSSRFLGIYIDNHLNWKAHIEHTVRKIQSHKWALRNLVKITSMDVSLLFFHAHVMSHLRYGIVLWGRSPHANDLFVEQKKIVRILFNLPYNHPCKAIFKQHNLFTLPSLYIFESLKYAVINNLIEYENLFPSHSYNTRHQFITPNLVHYSISKTNLRNSAVQIFNYLPLALKNILKSGQVSFFLRSLETFVLENAFYRVDELFHVS